MPLQEMLQAGLIVAGHDSREGGQVYGLPLGGTLVKVPFAIGEIFKLYERLTVHRAISKMQQAGHHHQIAHFTTERLCRCLLQSVNKTSMQEASSNDVQVLQKIIVNGWADLQAAQDQGTSPASVTSSGGRACLLSSAGTL